MTLPKDLEKERRRRQKISQSMKRKYANNPEYRERQRKGVQKNAAENMDWREHVKDGAKKRSLNPNWKKSQTEKNRRLAKDQNWRRKNKAGAKKRGADPAFRKRMSELMKIEMADPDRRKRVSELMKIEMADPDRRKRVSESQKGKTISKKTCERISIAHKKRLEDPEKYLLWVERNRRIGATQRGEKHHNYKGGTSFLPYCFRFNKRRRKATRKFFDYFCLCCGKHTNELRIGLSVHHVDHDKEQGCSGKPFNLVPLCESCHGKEQHAEEEYRTYINRTLEAGFAWGIWSREQYEIEVMYPEPGDEAPIEQSSERAVA